RRHRTLRLLVPRFASLALGAHAFGARIWMALRGALLRPTFVSGAAEPLRRRNQIESRIVSASAQADRLTRLGRQGECGARAQAETLALAADGGRSGGDRARRRAPGPRLRRFTDDGSRRRPDRRRFRRRADAGPGPP